LTGKVIRQLEISLAPSLKGVNIEITGTSGVELAPFPIPSVSQGIAQTVFAAAADPFGSAQVLMSGDFSGTRVDELIDTRETTLGEDVLRALFAFETIRSAQASLRRDQNLRQKIIALSIASGVLCSETAFIGFSNEVFRERSRLHFGGISRSSGRGRKSSGAPVRGVQCAKEPRTAPRSFFTCSAPPASVDCCDVNTSPPAPSDALLELIALQSIDGSWRIAEKVEKISGGAVVMAGELEEAVFATALAIAILRKRFSEQSAQWAMIERKAIRWLSRHTPDAEQIIAGLSAQLGV
jgi:hypothetical protein